jgi:hypothetical protein
MEENMKISLNEFECWICYKSLKRRDLSDLEEKDIKKIQNLLEKLKSGINEHLLKFC